MRAAHAFENTICGFRGEAFRTFVHPTAVIDRLLRARGFVERSYAGSPAWHVALYHCRASV